MSSAPSSSSSSSASSAAEERAYVTVAEFARHCGLSEVTIRRYLKKGLLPKFQPGRARSSVRIPREALAALAATDDAPPQSSPPQLDAVPLLPSKRSGPAPAWMKRARK